MTIYLDEKHRFDESNAVDLRKKLEHKTLRKLVRVSEIYYEPNPKETFIEDDINLLEAYYYDTDTSELERYSPWVLRIELDKAQWLNLRNIKTDDIVKKIEDCFA